MNARLRHGRMHGQRHLRTDLLILSEAGQDWFGIIEGQGFRRGAFRSVTDLNVEVCVFVQNWKDYRAHPSSGPRPPNDLLRTRPIVYQALAPLTGRRRTAQRPCPVPIRIWRLAGVTLG